jgi:hypothetical protein
MKACGNEACRNMLTSMQLAYRQPCNISTLEMWQLFIKELKSEAEYQKAANG